MKSFTIAAFVAVLAGLAQAAPSKEAHSFQAQITFEGAAGASFSLSVPTDGSYFPICMSKHNRFPPWTWASMVVIKR